MARVGLVLVGISLLLGGRLLGLLPVVLSIFLPKFKVLGWWLTVVMMAFLLAITGGAAVSVARNFSEMMRLDATMTRVSLGLMGLCVVGCVVALVGLLAKGTRAGVEQRTIAVAPHAFDEEAK